MTNRDHGLKIRISGLSNGLHDYSMETEPALLGLDANFTSPVRVRAHLDKSSRQLLLRTEVETSGRFQCDRCLEEFDKSIGTAYAVVYVYNPDDAAGVGEEEVQVITPETTMIDLGEDVRQMIVLSVPLKLLCREDCRGLCPHCGKNLNTGACDCAATSMDPRWNPLKSLLNR